MSLVRAFLTGLVLWHAAVGAVAAAEAVPDAPGASGEPRQVPRSELLKDLEIRAWGPWRQTAAGDYFFEGRVTISWRDSRIQADRLALSGGRFIEADGNVLVVWAGNRISGTRLTYDLEAETGAIEEAQGQVEQDFLFWARHAEKVGDRTVRLESARVTTCTQPVPYWSFSVSSATITVDQYAHMWNVRLQAGHMPLIYLPYLVWPVKEDRALGLLMPEFHSSDKLGNSVSEQLFVPLGRSADLTLLGTYYTGAGFGGGGELRFIPNQSGAGRISGFYIDDHVSERERYATTYQQTQQFRNGFRMVADINLVSDFDYYSDFERELNLISLPSILTRLEFSRNGRWVSMNARELRREQLFSDGTDLLQQTLPEVEWRGGSRKLGRTPFYLAFESSMASIRQQGFQQGVAIDADYLRGDLFPTLSLPWSPAPWFDVTPRVAYRWTYYTQSQRQGVDAGGLPTRDVLDDALRRDLWSGGLDVVGPKFYRIFERGERKFKHAIEPRVAYGYAEDFTGQSEILVYDEVDTFRGAGNLLTYGLTQRVFARRPRSRPEEAEAETANVLQPDGADAPPSTEPGDAGTEADAEGPPQPLESLEIASLELSQTRSFDRDLSVADLDGNGIEESRSRFGSVLVVGRYTPSTLTSLDLRANYDILYDALRDATLSGAIRRRLAQARFSLVHRNGLGVQQIDTAPDGSPIFAERENDTQVRVAAGLSLYRGKLGLLVDGVIDANPATGSTHIPDRRWRVQYRTQCCAFLLERLYRDYSSPVDRSDYYFRVDLSGIGKILDIKY